MNRRRILDIGFFLCVLLFGAALVRGCPETLKKSDENNSTSEEKSLLAKTSQNRIDLLSLINPDLDQVEGTWTRDGQAIVSPGLPFARCQVPFVPPEEYDLEIVVGRVAGKDSFNVGLVGRGRQLILVLDGWTNGDLSGIEQADGKPFFQNSTTYGGQLFRLHYSAKLFISVRRARVIISVDGKEIISWMGDFESIGFYKEWAVPDSRCIFIGSYEASFRIEKMDLIPIHGLGIRTR